MGFTRDGTMLATAGQDGTVELVDVGTRTPIGVALSIAPERYLAAGFDREVVGVVGAGGLARGLGGFIERPTQAPASPGG
jgi:hypothetical protein